VRGCHLGLFPSYYEPWGYTPVECLARGIPAVTSDLSGFGSYILSKNPDCEKQGLAVIHRQQASFDAAADELCGYLMNFLKLDLRKRITLRFQAQELSETFDWKSLVQNYHEAHALALK